MSSITKIRIETENFPPAHAEWVVDLGAGDMEQQLVYNNLAYDLVAVMIGRLGIEYSNWITGNQTRDEFDAVAREIQKAAVDAGT